jgi:MoaA/NifB/PqqE/SkfB family radical SAM enzyme
VKLTDAVLMVTSRCNSRCTMCEAWKDKSGVELPAENYWKLPETLRSINIVGGEPFMREDLPEVLQIISRRCKNPRLVISTNGILVDRIKKQLPCIKRNVPRLAVRISLDGIESVHDKVRGVAGNFERCMEVLRYCKGIGIKDIGFGTTVSKLNESTFFQVKELADDLQVQFTCTVAHSSPIYFGINDGVIPDPKVVIPQLRRIQRGYLESSTPKDWFRAYFTEGVIKYVEGKPKKINCEAGSVFVFIKANGDVFPCNLLDRKMGNFLENEMDEITYKSGEIPSYVHSCPKRCWMICTVVPMIRKNPFGPVLWVVRNKLDSVINKKRWLNAG